MMKLFLYGSLPWTLLLPCVPPSIAQSSSVPNNSGYSFTTESYNYQRSAPPSPVEGTVSWERLNPGPIMFSPRHSHATCSFQCPNEKERRKKCLWVTGGRTELHRTFNLEYEDRTADVWWSENGATWNKVENLTGDFLQGIGNFDAKHGGEVAPWYSRYGHSLDTVDTDGDGEDDIMVLMGGFNPIPSNDIWISPNGTTWFFERYAAWAERAYHSTAVFKGKLWIMGGSPLKNDVWSGHFIKDSTQRSGYRIGWTLEVDNGAAPWAPRAGMCVTTQLRKESNLDNPTNRSESKNNGIYTNNTIYTEYMYLIGGFAGWPRDDPRWNGDRTRNDVWITKDGQNWERVLPPQGQKTMPFIGRGWHACTTWHDVSDRSKRVNFSQINKDGVKVLPSASKEEDKTAWPKIYLSGGGYMGTKGNNDVRKLEGYVDLWWTHDGSEWTRVDYEEGTARDSNLYSTNEWALTLDENNQFVNLGKWGHTLETFSVEEDLNLDGDISNSTVALEFCAGSTQDVKRCKIVEAREDMVPALFVIAGDTTHGGPIVNDVFVSRPGVTCEINGVTCSGRGSCGPGTLGCVCNSERFQGEHCENFDYSFVSSAARTKLSITRITSGAVFVAVNLIMFIFN